MTIEWTPSLRANEERRSATRLTSCITPRSAFVIAWISGRWTLTATSLPSARVARWTWAVEAAANGSWSKVAKISSGGLPSCLAMISLACSYGNGATSLWRRASSSAHSGGRDAPWLAAIWPIFT